MTIGAAETTQPTRFVLPHRGSRLILNAVLLGLIAALLTGIASEPTKTIVLTCWVLFACLVLVRTWRAAIIVDDTRLVAVNGISTRHVKRADIALIDLRPPRVGEFTSGKGERMVAVLKNGKQISLTFNPLIRRYCQHLSEMARSLNKMF
jgi:hypothetical protein